MKKNNLRWCEMAVFVPLLAFSRRRTYKNLGGETKI